MKGRQVLLQLSLVIALPKQKVRIREGGNTPHQGAMSGQAKIVKEE